MAKFYGNIGYCKLTETAPGVHTEEITVRPYYGIHGDSRGRST